MDISKTIADNFYFLYNLHPPKSCTDIHGRIISLGKPIISLILIEIMDKTELYWRNPYCLFRILEQITGEYSRQLSSENNGEFWLRWGEENGYL